MASTTPIPGYLDFNTLRGEAITHLGNLTGKIWTDFNVHDPGITILEVLCYALLDLDYRSKLPAADIFAPNPGVIGPDDNFYSPAQILACNPLTVLDYRKLLSDIEGVRNAWLEVAVNRTDDDLNGLYHVYIEKEEDETPEETIKEAVLQQLWSHRNLCEDFVDITFVGKQEMGICAIIELETNADIVEVYLDMMQRLTEFLSPTPHFYTLQELLDKNTSIDAIFAGRPYSTINSHGFIDTDELKNIQLKRELHLSDLYKVLFETGGIRTIRDLQWKTCNGNISRAWKFNILENNVVDFKPSCCGIQFLSNGKPVPFDPTQYEALLKLAIKKNLYKTLLPNLDLPFPKGTFRDDLADYYSIQNDFPGIYGISKGGIPENAPLARKAWALQLKGFLLFFDQLLADYLSQLANIRSLFSMSSDGATTYFLNTLDNSDNPDGPNYVPDVNLLWRSYVTQPLSDILGGDGATLVFPASRQTLTPLDYGGWEEMQDLITRLKADFATGNIAVNYLPFNKTEYYYYISTSLSDTVLVSKNTFPNKDNAKAHADFVLNNGMLDKSYSLFSIAGDKFTFTLQYNKTPLGEILHSGMEDPALYTRRRKYFLDHLLSRFAEKFTDFALLQYGPASEEQKAREQIAAEQNYVSRYALLGSGRGQAGNYTTGKWNTDNISGLEKKWKALIGAGNDGRQSLCNFITRRINPDYSFSLKIGDKVFSSPAETYSSEEEAYHAATALLAAMTDRSEYAVQESAADSFILVLHDSPGHTVPLLDTYPSEIYASTIADRLAALFGQKPSPRDVFVSATGDTSQEPSRWKFHYYLGFEDNNRFCFDSVTEYESADAAMDALRQLQQNLSALTLQQESENWTLHATDPAIPVLQLITGPAATAPGADLLQFQQTIQKIVANPDPKDYAVVTPDDSSKQGLYVWQLANIDHPTAFCTQNYPDRASAEKDRDRLAGLLKQGVKYLRICMDGRVTRKRKDPQTKEYGYHYLVKSQNYFYSSGREMILFESIKGYPSEAEAKKAFTDSYFSLFEWASKDTNYGPLINLTEIISNNPPADSPIVFIPKETKVALGGADADVIKKMMDIAGSYPIKRKGSNTSPNSYVYYCGLTIPDPNGTSFEWESIRRFKTIAEAQLDFDVLIRLLGFPGNLFTEACDSKDGTTYRLYINEVLAQSAGRFSDEKTAWEGVDKFICAFDEEKATLPYQAEDCTHTFLVNCGLPLFQHSFTYPTPKTRDAALDQLISAFAQWDSKAFTAYRENNFLVLTEAQGQPFAKAPITDENKDDDIHLAMALITKIYEEGAEYIIVDDFVQLIDAGKNPIASSYHTGVHPKDWQHLLEHFMDQYPFVPAGDQFFIELNLPGAGCDTAWKSTCGFTDSAKATQTLEKGLALMAKKENYLRVFSSNCRSFEIALVDPNDKVAIHPQAYITRESVIDALQRTKKAVNVEGLHLIEHILLRPREAAPNMPAPGIPDARCNPPVDIDPIWPMNDSTFIPGRDPWSFIATVVLPAWPGKFNHQDNKIVLENILYREAPAHIMLRVLWLTPKDCYRFETQYKTWLKRPDTAFAGYLFKKFDTPAPCEPCNTCPDTPPAAAAPCNETLKASRAKQLPLLSAEISKLYCWTKEDTAPPPTNE